MPPGRRPVSHFSPFEKTYELIHAARRCSRACSATYRARAITGRPPPTQRASTLDDFAIDQHLHALQRACRVPLRLRASRQGFADFCRATTMMTPGALTTAWHHAITIDVRRHLPTMYVTPFGLRLTIYTNRYIWQVTQDAPDARDDDEDLMYEDPICTDAHGIAACRRPPA